MPSRIAWDPPAVPFQLSHVRPLGVTHDVLLAGMAAGRISRLGRGVYIASSALPSDPVGLVLLRAVAAQMRRPDAIASHSTAAFAWGLPLADSQAALAGPLHFTVPPLPGRRCEKRSGLAVAVRRLPAEHRAHHPVGLFLTTPARTAVDLAVGLRLPEALIAADATARLALMEKVGESRLRRAYLDSRKVAESRRPMQEAVAVVGTRLNRAHLLQVTSLADPRRESALESLSFGHMVCAGLPLPQLQVELATSDGPFFADFLWPEAGVVGESDGMSKLATAEDVQRQHLREEILRQEHGLRFVRWTYAELARRPAAVMERIGRRLPAQ